MTGLLGEVPTKVPLPEWIFKKAKNDKELRGLVLQYMQRYPHLKIKKIIIAERLAICYRKRLGLDGEIR